MAEVDPNDDDLDRWVVWHFRYDEERRERRNVIVGCYDNDVEFKDRIDQASLELKDAKDAGRSEQAERIGGVHWPAGHKRRMASSRLRPRLKKARERRRHRS